MKPALERIVHAADGWRLSVIDLECDDPWALAIVGHAMMVDRRTVYRADRPSLAGTLRDAGMRVLVPDQRGHGASGPGARAGGRWTYDDMIGDVGLYLELARSLAPSLPIVLVGNSLFGHLAFSYLGMHTDAPVKAVVGFAVNIWNRRWTASCARWWAKRAFVAASLPVVTRLGYLPARRLGLGSEDEPLEYWRSMWRWVPGDCWDGDDGTDYAALMERVPARVLVVVSDGDRLLSHPDDALLFTAALGRRREVVRLGPHCAVETLRGLEPRHVEMVASPRCAPLWQYVARWIRSVASAEATT